MMMDMGMDLHTTDRGASFESELARVLESVKCTGVGEDLVSSNDFGFYVLAATVEITFRGEVFNVLARETEPFQSFGHLSEDDDVPRHRRRRFTMEGSDISRLERVVRTYADSEYTDDIFCDLGACAFRAMHLPRAVDEAIQPYAGAYDSSRRMLLTHVAHKDGRPCYLM